MKNSKAGGLTQKKPSKKRIAEDIAKLGDMGIYAYEVGGYIHVNGDIHYTGKTIKNVSMFEYITLVEGSLDFPNLQTFPKKFFPRLERCSHLNFPDLQNLPKRIFPKLESCWELYFTSLKILPQNAFLRLWECGNLRFDSLITLHQNAFQTLKFCGCLYFPNLQTLPKNAFPSLMSCFDLFFNSLQNLLKCSFINLLQCGDFHPENIKKKGEDGFVWRKKTMREGYYPELGLAKFDDIFSIITSVKKVGEYTFYLDIEGHYIAQIGNYTAHAKNLKKAVEDLNFKIKRDKIKQDGIASDTVMTAELYRTITGACDMGVKGFISRHGIQEGITAIELLKILEANNAYGLDAFKGAIQVKTL